MEHFPVLPFPLSQDRHERSKGGHLCYMITIRLSFHRALVCFVDLCASSASETMKVGSGSQSDAEEITWHMAMAQSALNSEMYCII